MSLGYEVAEIGWDLSIRVQSKRAMSINSVWLRKANSGLQSGASFKDWHVDNYNWGQPLCLDLDKCIDPMLGVNLLGDFT